MHNILKIITFHTPIESIDTTEHRELQIQDMVWDFIVNSGEDFQVNHTGSSIYQTIRYIHKNLHLSLDIKQDIEMINYWIPHMILSVDLVDSHLERSVVDDFLNTIVRFFSGTLSDQYFIEYDSVYHIDDMNQGKKYSIKDIATLDMEKLHDPNNKNLLDSLLYLHYTLQQQLLAIGIAQHDIDTFLDSTTARDNLIQTLSFSRERAKTITENLLQNIHILHTQIQILLSYFTHKI